MNATVPAHLHRDHRARPMSEDALSVLKLLAVTGPTTRNDIEKLITTLRDPRVTLTNLVTQKYVVSNHDEKPVTYGLTNKARERLQAADVPLRKPRRSSVATGKAHTPRLDASVYRAGKDHYGARPGADQCARLPSRFGDRLRWPGGAITDLDGNPIATP